MEKNKYENLTADELYNLGVEYHHKYRSNVAVRRFVLEGLPDISHEKYLSAIEAGRLAVELWTLAADKGQKEAKFWLALCYSNAWGVSYDIHKAIKLLEELATDGYVEAMDKLYCIYTDKVRDKEKSNHWLVKGAEAGHYKCMYDLALRIENNDNPDLERALELYEKAMAAGHNLAEWHVNDLRKRLKK